MEQSNFASIDKEGFVGKARPDWLAGLCEGRLSKLAKEVASANEGVLARRRHQVVVLDFEYAGKRQPLAVKFFGKQHAWKDSYDQKRGSKAARSFYAALFLETHGVGSPPPVAFLERWEGSRLKESFYLSEYIGELESFKTELLRLYESNGPCADLVHLLERVGSAMRKMHDAGFYHRDLGNQNIELLPENSTHKKTVYFLDLNRGRIRKELSIQERALDFSRLKLPSAFLDILVRIYWRAKAPADFSRALAKQRRRFYWWQKSRLLRHPVKNFRKSRKPRSSLPLDLNDVWIWDNRSAQAAIIFNRKDRIKCHSWTNNLKIAYSSLKALPSVRRQYADQMIKAFQQPVSMASRVGMSLEPEGIDFEKQLVLLTELGASIPVLIRIGHHQGKEQWELSLGYIERLKTAGYSIAVAILQDRRAILEPESWQAFLEYLFQNLEGKVELVEVGHVVNRVKWGVHNLNEYRELVSTLLQLKKKYPSIQISGPACIDFELYHTAATLDQLPEGFQFDMLAHHLYVDRRGAPENKQAGFDAVEKAALLKAVAVSSKNSSSRVIVSEVNWPLIDTSVWSPVAASYQLKGAKGSRVHVTEEQYGNYMVRYLALVLCSGFVDRVYWWRLVAHGFGLVDEREPEGWRKRVGFQMLQTFLKELGNATFIEKLTTEDNVYALRFEREYDHLTLIWCNGAQFKAPWPVAVDRVIDAEGHPIEATEVGESPIYLITKKTDK